MESPPRPLTSPNRAYRITSYNVCYTKLLRVHQPIHKDVSEAVNRVQQVMAETAELAIHQRVALGNANPALAPRPKSVVIIEDDPESARNLGKILVDNSCEAVIYRYGSEFARDIDEISADIA